MNRELTKREKTLLLVLVVLVLVLGYCKLFLEPIDRQIIDALSASANVNFLSNVDVQYDADKAQYKTVLHLIFFELMP